MQPPFTGMVFVNLVPMIKTVCLVSQSVVSLLAQAELTHSTPRLMEQAGTMVMQWLSSVVVSVDL